MIFVAVFVAVTALSLAFGAGAIFSGANRALGLIGLILAAVILALPFIVVSVIS